MPSLSMLTQEKGKTIEKIMNKTTIQMLHYSKLKPSDMNFYGQTGIEELADSLALAGRILQPLIVRRTDIGEYEVLAGHRRRKAAILNIQKGMKQFEFLPCIVLSNSDLEQMGDVHGEDVEAYLRYVLIATNSSTRELTEYERMLQTIQLEEILPKMRGDENLKGRALRAEIAKETKKSTGTVGTYRAIWRHLIPEYMALFEKSVIGISVAAGISGLEKGKQEQLFEEKHGDVSLKDIEQIKTVSDSDTECKEDTVNTEWKRIPADEKTAERVVKLVLFDFPYREELIKALQIDLNTAIRCLEQYLPYKNSCVEISEEFGYKVRFLIEQEETVLPKGLFWEKFKVFNVHRFLEDEAVGETTSEPDGHEVLPGQLTTRDIGIEPKTVSDSDTEEEIATGESDHASNLIEKGFHVCVQGMKGCYMCETFQAKDEYEAAEKIKRGIQEQLFGNDLKKMEIRVTVNRV